MASGSKKSSSTQRLDGETIASVTPLRRSGSAILEEEGPPIPLGRRLVLPGRGTTFFRESGAPAAKAPTVVLLHGWIASAGLNWYKCFDPLGEHFNVVAPDMRGHGRGIRSWRRFRLSDCADDVAAMCRELGISSAIFAGYSMGGPIAQLLWKRHPDLVSGLVFSATSSSFVPGLRGQIFFTGPMVAVAGTTRLGSMAARTPLKHLSSIIPSAPGGRPSSIQTWAAGEMARHDTRMLMEAGSAIGLFNSNRWVGGVDVPTSVVITTKDRSVTPSAQLDLALAIPGAQLHRLDEGHVAPVSDAFGDAITEACLAVSKRISAGGSIRSG